MLTKITSSQNANIKKIKSLMLKKERQKESEFIIEGLKLLNEAIDNNAEIKEAVISEELYNSGNIQIKKLIDSNIHIFIVPSRLIGSISDTVCPQGIIAVVSFLKTYDEISGDFIIILDHIQDPGNLGTIIRTSDAAGVDMIIKSDDSADLYNPKVVRSTMGSIFHIPVLASNDLLETIEYLKQKDYKIIGSCLNGDDFFKRKKLNEKIALVIGNEANGINPEILANADYLYKIPMIGKAESLNASIAAAVMIYDFVRERLY